MTITIERPYPVSATVVMRTTLFALANMGAKLQAYNEDAGVIVATLTKRMGLQKSDVIVRIRPFGETSQLELQAPDVERAHELLDLVSNYVRDGAKIKANATMQWVDLQRQQEGQVKRQQLLNKARNLLPGVSNAEETAVVPVGEEESAILPADVTPSIVNMPIPDNPGVLVKNQQDRIVELKIDPDVFTDRSAYLQVCEGCSATVLQGSMYCSNCGRPLLLKAVQPELRTGAAEAAGSSLTYALIAVALNIVPFLILILPVILNDSSLSVFEKFSEWITPLKIAIAAVLGIAPSVFLGVQAISRARHANWYMNLRAATDVSGRTRANIGNALGWLAIYMGIGWTLFIIIATLVDV